MNITKLDRRYKGYNRGFRYRVEFRIGPRFANGDPLWSRYQTIIGLLENTYGKELEWIHNGVTTQRRYNDNYRIETPANKWYRQLYLRNEQDITVLLLAVGA